MTALATLGVDTNRAPAHPRDLRDSFDELPPGHTLYSDVSVRQVKPIQCASRPRDSGRIDAARLRRENRATSMMSNVVDRSDAWRLAVPQGRTGAAAVAAR